MVAPVPIGPTASFSNVPAGSIATATFKFGVGYAVITFQPIDVDNPGTATLYDSTDTAVATLSTEGYESFVVPSTGDTYYFKATLGAKLLAMTQPSAWR